MKKYTVVGDSKKVTLPVNDTKLKVVGNKCVVRVTKSYGEIEMIGNDCRLEVEDNYGAIHVVGYNCVVSVKRRWKGDRVQLIGQRTQLLVDGKKKVSGYESQLSPFSKDLDDMIDSIFNFGFVNR